MRPERVSRRQILDVSAEVARLAGEIRSAFESAAGRRSLTKLRRKAMGCWFELFLPAERPDWVKTGIDALDRIEQIEAMLSVYRADSDLSRVNAAAGDRPVEVSEGLFEFLLLCRDMWRRTGGAFDPAAGALVELWGFRNRRPRRPAPEEIEAALNRSGMRHVALNDAQRTVRYQRPGLSLDPGAIGKGWAIDRACAILEAAGVNDFLLAGGGSSIRARGRAAENGWPVSVPGVLLNAPEAAPNTVPSWGCTRQTGSGTILLADRAISTSGATEQFFEHRGARYAHVIDPRTGVAVQRTGLVTVLASTAAVAEAFSTAWFIAPPE